MAIDDRLSAIIDDPGFQRVAAAIRKATRGALYAKLQGDRTYPVHYGLAQDLKRKALYKTEFIGALSEFITEFNSENLRADERRQRRRAAVSADDIAAVARLLDEHNPQTVAQLLIAFGYAKAPGEAQEEVEAPEDLQEQEILAEEEA